MKYEINLTLAICLTSFMAILMGIYLHNTQSTYNGKLLKHDLVKVPITIADCKTYYTIYDIEEKICNPKNTYNYILTLYIEVGNETITLIENCKDCLEKINNKMK